MTSSETNSLEHGVTFDEAVEGFFRTSRFAGNKRYYRDRYQLLGRTFGGRRLKIIFQLKPQNVVRIITGWPIYEKAENTTLPAETDSRRD